jgi:hypothetical protein
MKPVTYNPHSLACMALGMCRSIAAARRAIESGNFEGNLSRDMTLRNVREEEALVVHFADRLIDGAEYPI